jgi:predicted O-linked N-acetylglucosamine transferase (SPINDLY family)
MGVPVVTCLGTTFAGRVAASLLHAVGLPELVTRSPKEYEALAMRLANDAEALARLQRRLALQRERSTLFDTDATRRAIEAAYSAMWARHLRGEQPASFAVDHSGAAVMLPECR